jgi:hypothetical protein
MKSFIINKFLNLKNNIEAIWLVLFTYTTWFTHTLFFTYTKSLLDLIYLDTGDLNFMQTRDEKKSYITFIDDW